ncbi:MAG: cell division protein ZapA [Prevotellaceae bacterium]|jgi:cell division protein ZapA|nr:cell division protein ZapA [Prevotellaceae bacterium]
MEDDRLSVRITIADRKYPLKIARQNEEQLRKAARLINEELDRYRDFADRDIQDKLAITALQFVFKLLDVEENKSLLSLQKDLQGLDSELESYLNKQTGSLQ